MVPEDDRASGRYVVDPIVEPGRRTDRVLGKPENSGSKPAAVGVVSNNKGQAGDDGDKERIHVIGVLWGHKVGIVAGPAILGNDGRGFNPLGEPGLWGFRWAKIDLI